MARRRRHSILGSSRASWTLRLVALAILGVVFYLNQPAVQNPDLEPRPPWRESRTDSGTSPSEQVLVERVVDGDTLVVAGGDRVRLIGVDTPETHHPSKPAEPFGLEAFEYTREMVEGKHVTLQFDPGESRDRYGRTLAYVYVDGQFLNEALLLNGYARALTRYPFSAEMKSRFRAAEAQAKSKKIGIWSQPPRKVHVTRRESTKGTGPK